MNKITIFLIIAVLQFFCVQLLAQENPFMKMANQKFADYAQELHEIGLKLDLLDTVQIQRVIKQFEEVAKKTGSNPVKI